VGYGYMGHIYRKAFGDLKDQRLGENYYKIDLDALLSRVSLTSVVDPSVSREDEQLLREGGIAVFKDIGDLLSSPSAPDAAVISSPIGTHYGIAKAFLERGASILVEKPVCPTETQIRSLAKLAKAHRCSIFPAHVERYNPVCLDAKEYVGYKIMGAVRGYSMRRCSPKPERVRESLIVDKLIHDIDLIHSIFGPFKVRAVGAHRVDGDIREVSVTTVHRGGYEGSILSSWLVEEKERSIQIEFDRGRLYGDLLQKKLRVFRKSEFSKEITGYGNNQIKDQLLDFIATLHYPTRPLVRIEDAIRAAKVIDRIMELAQ